MERFDLKQRAFFEKREFKITATGVETYTKNFEIDSTDSWSFDNFEKKNRIYTEKKPDFLKWGLITILIGVVRGLFYIGDDSIKTLVSGVVIIIVGLLIIGYYFLTQKKYLLMHLDNDKQLFVLYDKPSKIEFNEFIETFYKKRAQYFRDNYFYIDFDGEKENQISRMKWLKHEDVINEEEYINAIEEIRIKMI